MGQISKQHQEIMDKINRVYPHYKIKPEYHLGQRLFLDIYIPTLSVGIEVNGIQHYEFVPFFHGHESKFEEYKFLDRKKALACMEQGIGLFVIRYDEDFDIETFSNFVLKHLENQIDRSDKNENDTTDS